MNHKHARAFLQNLSAGRECPFAVFAARVISIYANDRLPDAIGLPLFRSNIARASEQERVNFRDYEGASKSTPT